MSNLKNSIMMELESAAEIGIFKRAFEVKGWKWIDELIADGKVFEHIDGTLYVKGQEPKEGS